jgi:hypothetical protein
MITRRQRAMLLGATLLAGGGAAAAMAQGIGNTYDPAQMPAFHGKVTQYDLNPRGDVDGLILDDGTEVHFPPHLGTEVVAAVRPGEAVTIHGLKARALPLVMAMSVTGDASGKTVVDNGPPGPGRHGPPPPHGPMGPRGMMGMPELQAQGVVKMQLHGPRGELNGVLLADGTMVHFPPPDADRLSAMLVVGQTIMVRGNGVENSLGRAIGAEAIGPSADKMVEIAPPHGHHHPGGPDGPGGPGDDDAGPGGHRGGPPGAPPPPR